MSGGPGPSLPWPKPPHLSVPLLDGTDGQWALDAPLTPQEHLSLVSLIQLWLTLGLWGVHGQAEDLGKSNGSSGRGYTCQWQPWTC